MGILSRMLRLYKADVHGVMDQLEDKGLLLKQYLREMEASLKVKTSRLAKIDQNCRQVERELTQCRDEALKLEKDLDLAVSKDKDDIARMLIRKRRTLQNNCELLSGQLEQLKEEQNTRSQTLDRQRLQYDQLKVKTGSFCQQAEYRAFEEAVDARDSSQGWKAPTEEEIELELLQRKEALAQGGAP